MTTTSTPSSTTKAQTVSDDALRLIDVDHVRFYVGNAKQAAHFYAYTFGFKLDQIADLTTGSRDEANYLLTQGNIRFILTSGLSLDHEAHDHVKRYGDGVRSIAFTVDDAEAAFNQAVKNGAEAENEPTTISNNDGSITTSAIKIYGRVIHTFVSRSGKYSLENVRKGGLISPAFAKVENYALNDYNQQNPCGLKYLDHCVGNVELGKMDYWVSWYENVLGFKLFKHFDDDDISTEYSALMSKVMDSGYGVIKFPINEPAPGKKKSQIQEYLDWHDNTAGVQHLAMRTNDELSSVTELNRRGVDFLYVPKEYYNEVWDRVNKMLKENGHDAVKEDHEKIKELGILVDADDEGYLLQLFTKPLQDRPTLFFEIICRRGSQSFGKGNFKALFESLEQEQERRGNL
ncbi:MAG: 4-hydroxyphenylpyruvate dioxygenase [Planctomycetes bacterium]|nr:4-hydroxyphenylpyruvate dioxygenase [Planctomycetota bacterium]